MSARGGPQVIPRPRGARPGRPAPWSEVPAAGREIPLDHVRATLDGRGPSKRVNDPARPTEIRRHSAVLVPLYEHQGETWVVLTRRSPDLRSHRHEVSFPGGVADHDDRDLWHTARREASEEVALDPDMVEPIGELDSFVTFGSQSLVHPLVGAVPGRPRLRANPAEVEKILHVPLSELLSEEVWREELWPIFGTVRPISFFELIGDTVWGATGAMLRQLLSIVTGVADELTY